MLLLGSIETCALWTVRSGETEQVEAGGAAAERGRAQHLLPGREQALA